MELNGNTPRPRRSRGKGGGTKQDYERELQRLCDGSTTGRRSEAFVTIPWDDPDYALDPNDSAWKLGPELEMGAHPWYQSLPEEEQIRIGKYRYAHTIEVGSQFEQSLIDGAMGFVDEQPMDSLEARYVLHEATEETHHIQMFREFVKRTSVDTKGAPAWFRRIVPLLADYAGRKLPVTFWSAVLAGEEPIDHLQRTVRKNANIPKLLDKIMEVHISEEARHISFAHMYLERHVKPEKMTRAQRAILAVTLPLTLRSFANVMIKPDKRARKDMGIPKSVTKELWFKSEAGKENLRNMFPDARKLADNIGMRDGERKSKIGKLAWRVLGLDGPSS